MSWAQCPTCDVEFTSDGGFDRHRNFTCDGHRPNQHRDECWEDRRCLSIEEMAAAGWRQNGRGRWTHRPPRTAPSAVPHERRAANGAGVGSQHPETAHALIGADP